VLDRDRRFEILAQGDAGAIMALAEDILMSAEVAVVTPPRVGTMMLRHREPVAGTQFNAGEVLVTEASVALGPYRGYAMRLGRDLEATLAAAVIDAAAEAQHVLTPQIGALLAELVARAEAEDAAHWREVAATRVVFDEMS
jgi:alpha-D-ribose 1-methylphosphonate 5-triphosphate synthase subunit PhnG